MKSGKEGRFTRVAAFRFVLPLQASSLFLFLFGGACSYASFGLSLGFSFSLLVSAPRFIPSYYFCFICLSPSCFSLVIRSSPLTSVASPVLPSVGFSPFFFVFHRRSAPFVRSVLALGGPLFPSALSREESSPPPPRSERAAERKRESSRATRQTHTRTTCVFPFASARASPLPPLRSLVRIVVVVVGRPASAAAAAATSASTAVFRCAVLGWVVTAAAVSSLPRAAPPTRPRRRRRRDGLCRLALSASLLGRARAASRR